MQPVLRLALLTFFALNLACASDPKLAAQSPPEIYGDLFERVQLAPVYSDSKTFPDMEPRHDPQRIVENYQKEKPADLRAFVEKNFRPPLETASTYQAPTGISIDEHIKKLWQVLRRHADGKVAPASSLIPLPHSYIVPGGRFREIYYWDSYFTQLGLLADNEDDTFRDMVLNFEHLILTTGKIPNGNRDYYRSRSQPPFFSHMVELWQQRFANPSALQFLKALRKEHSFWMAGERAVQVTPDGFLNRYWDDRAEPRPEAYKEDVELARKATPRAPEETYRDLRAAAESGWDFSTRWFADPQKFSSIQTTSYLPVDLNALLFHLEFKIAELARLSGDQISAEHYKRLALRRRDLIRQFMWDERTGTFRDYNWRTKSLSIELTIAMVAPLFVDVATPDQAKKVAAALQSKFLKSGGMVTTLRKSDQQWDAPNGWPPHQWMAYVGLKKYAQDKLAEDLRARWLKLNQKVFHSTGKLMEKYNVVDMNLESGGGEYPTQDGFGWTNGVYRALSLGYKTPQGAP